MNASHRVGDLFLVVVTAVHSVASSTASGNLPLTGAGSEIRGDISVLKLTDHRDFIEQNVHKFLC